MNPSADLERILRWERAGGEFRLLDESDGSVTVSLLRCDAGEEIDRFMSSEDDVRKYVGG